MNPSGASEWTDLFVAAAGASAALTGLVFVAVSINIQEILRLPGVPDRALATLMLLLGAVVISLLPLIPDQSGTALGIELVVVGIAFIVVIGVTGARSFQRADNPAVRIELVVLAGLGTVPYVVGGLLRPRGRRRRALLGDRRRHRRDRRRGAQRLGAARRDPALTRAVGQAGAGSGVVASLRVSATASSARARMSSLAKTCVRCVSTVRWVT